LASQCIQATESPTSTFVLASYFLLYGWDQQTATSLQEKENRGPSLEELLKKLAANDQRTTETEEALTHVRHTLLPFRYVRISH